MRKGGAPKKGKGCDGSVKTKAVPRRCRRDFEKIMGSSYRRGEKKSRSAAV